MKAQYLIPETEIIKVEAYALLETVSGAGLKEGGQDDGTHIPRAPGIKPF